MSLDAIDCLPKPASCHPEGDPLPSAPPRESGLDSAAQPPQAIQNALRLSRLQQTLLHRAARLLEQASSLLSETLPPAAPQNPALNSQFPDLASELAGLAKAQLGGEPVFSENGTAVELDPSGNKLIMAAVHGAASLLPTLLQSNRSQPETARELVQAARARVDTDALVVAENIHRLSWHLSRR